MTRGTPVDPDGVDPLDADELDLRAVDVTAVAATDRMLDRLGARHPHATDLDDPAGAVLALLAADVDRFPVSENAVRRELFDLGGWPIGPDDTAQPVCGPAWQVDPDGAPVPDRPTVRPARLDARPPRQVRVRLLAVAAGVVLLFGVSAVATGVWEPPGRGPLVAGTDESARIQGLLSDGMQLVAANDLDAAKAKLVDAAERSKDADLTPEQRRQVDAALQHLWSTLNARGVALPDGLLPGGLLPGGVATPLVPGDTLPGDPPDNAPSVATSPTTAPGDPSAADDQAEPKDSAKGTATR